MAFVRHIVAALFYVVLLERSVSFAQDQLTPTFYDQTCPNVTNIIRGILLNAAINDPRITASLVRLHFHDCFVQGCDGSILLDDPDTTEKVALPNNNSARGYEVIDQMKAALENVCAQTVSCADILTIAAEESVVLAGGPSWKVPLGRLDSRSANRSLANTALPGFNEPLDDIKAKFAAVGLDTSVDVVALSGAHTFGRAQCFTFDQRLYNFSGTGDQDPDLNETLAARLREICPTVGLTNLTNLDQTTPDVFDNTYFKNLQVEEGLLRSDQILFSTQGADTVGIVNDFSSNQTAFFEDFVESMIRMGNIRPLADVIGEVRLNCRVVNANISIAATDAEDARLVSST
ncbi:Peroxidase 54 [Hibiscus syriacus]|uniref:Peroxidase n=2 Tax=Hibiscus syriacus TaxID=106335 RepID=A0A6A2Z660_HIBSY|nr:Peroxidase 54 [Hibiscus syriacus]